MLSEFSTALAKDAETAYAAGAPLAALLCALAAIECHLRHEYAGDKRRQTLYELICIAPIAEELKRKLHVLREVRNTWVHIDDPAEDSDLLSDPAYYESMLEETAGQAIRAMIEVLCLEQWV